MIGSRHGYRSHHRAIEAVWRIESARSIARPVRLVRDVGPAEELAQDAFVAALEQWPAAGVPDKPGAWLMATAGDLFRLVARYAHERKLLQEPVPLDHGLMGLFFLNPDAVVVVNAGCAGIWPAGGGGAGADGAGAGRASCPAACRSGPGVGVVCRRPAAGTADA